MKKEKRKQDGVSVVTPKGELVAYVNQFSDFPSVSVELDGEVVAFVEYSPSENDPSEGSVRTVAYDGKDDDFKAVTVFYPKEDK